MGRWRSGAPLVLSPDKDDPELGADPQRNNDFNYKEMDPHGYAVPLGSHARRMNPRDTAANMNRRRMIRRDDWIFTVRLGWGHRGLAFSTSCVATSNFLILYLLMRAHLGRLESRAMGALLAKLALSCMVLLGVAWAGGHWLLADWAVQPFWPKLLSLVAVIACAAGAFFLCASALGIGELQDITRSVTRSVRRKLRRPARD